jgi:hypothetical protein
MRDYLVCVCLASLLVCVGLAQQPAMKKPAEGGKSADASAESTLKDVFESKVQAEWEALKKKDKKAFGDLLADEYEGVEVDGTGERSKIQAITEVPAGNVYNYTLWGFRVTPLGPDATLVIYEVTMQFPPRSVLRYSRLYISELWVKRNGEWKELHYQETHVK